MKTRDNFNGVNGHSQSTQFHDELFQDTCKTQDGDTNEPCRDYGQDISSDTIAQSLSWAKSEDEARRFANEAFDYQLDNEKRRALATYARLSEKQHRIKEKISDISEKMSSISPCEVREGGVEEMKGLILFKFISFLIAYLAILYSDWVIGYEIFLEGGYTELYSVAAGMAAIVLTFACGVFDKASPKLFSNKAVFFILMLSGICGYAGTMVAASSLDFEFLEIKDQVFLWSNIFKLVGQIGCAVYLMRYIDETWRNTRPTKVSDNPVWQFYDVQLKKLLHVHEELTQEIKATEVDNIDIAAAKQVFITRYVVIFRKEQARKLQVKRKLISERIRDLHRQHIAPLLAEYEEN